MNYDNIDEATVRNLVDALTKKLANEGRLIEGGWVGLCHAMMPANASKVQRREMRRAFFAGAQHLYASIMCILEPGTEATENDMRVMGLIADELKTFGEDLKKGMN